MSERTWEAQTIPLVWESARPAVSGIEGRIRAELQSDLEDLDHPSDLVFHIILLEDRLDGPSVVAFGRDGSDAVHLEYDAKTEWLTA